MASSQVNKYLLGRDINASSRLYLQHWIWKRQLGYLLHPAVPISDRHAALKVADVACGTGIWLVDLAKELPNAQLDGFDVSTAQFPHRKWLPPNVTLRQMDAYGEVPQELVGRYDIVHIGLVVVLVKDGNPGRLLTNLLKLLKPGGYLQWNEADIEDMHPIPASPDIPRASAEEFYTVIWKVLEEMELSLDVRWVRKLGQTFSRCPGLHCVLAEEVAVSDDLAQPASQAHLASLGEMVERVSDEICTKYNLRELYEGAANDVQNGVSVRMGQVIAVGRKDFAPGR